MSTTLFVRLPHRPHDQPQPWRLGAMPFALVRDPVTVRGRRDASAPAPHLLRDGRAEVADLPAADRLVLIVAATDVLATSAMVPPLAPNRLRLALPNLVEDALAGDAQAAHIAVGPEIPAADATGAAAAVRGPRRRLLMIAERAWLRAVLDAFAAHPHRRRHLLPAQFCLPLMPVAEDGTPVATLALEAAASALADAASLLEGGTPADDAGERGQAQSSRVWQLTVRAEALSGYGLLLGDDALPAWSALAPAGVWYGDGAAASLPVLTGEAPRTRPLDWQTWIAGALACLQDRSLDLAQFEFAQGRADRWQLRAWRLPLALAAGLLIVQMVGMNVHWLMLRQEQARLQDAQVQLFRAAFPNTPVIVDPALQMRRQLDQLRLASGRSTPDDFLPLADKLAQAGRNLPPDALLALEYRGRALHAVFKSGTDLAGLRSAARQAGLSMEEDRGPQDGGRAAAGAPPGGVALPTGSRWIIRPAL
ncbi:type II secretion system protein GspL [Cupriavidus sp. AU9028]|uniref:type II secretion system protein GspL n=1 Tax=Cupriavidus sp. AU9028 TaxID=2871157 RepID=UPI001C97AEC3|nr:type II secretion system protein GspL [Cupriavidus sp. AU9028]MBY4898995.1 type II secretion system protein GspL [Cupriavidus sp. AU9028]